MGAMRKMAVYLGLVEDEGLEYVDDDYADARPARETAPAHQYSSVREVRPEPRVPARTPEPAARPSARPAETAVAPRVHEPVDAFGVGDLYRITTLHPRTYNDARRIGEEFREATPVIINLSEMDDADAKRIIDFSAGLVFGLQGTIERVTNKVFLLSPANVDVGAEARAQIAQDGFFNQS